MLLLMTAFMKQHKAASFRFTSHQNRYIPNELGACLRGKEGSCIKC
jgi:hypothetical protein